MSSMPNMVSSAKNSASALWHPNNRLRGTHWVRPWEIGRNQPFPAFSEGPIPPEQHVPWKPIPPKFGGEIHHPNLGGEPSKIACFIVFFQPCHPNLGGEIITPRIWGVWVFRGPGNSRKRRKKASFLRCPPTCLNSDLEDRNLLKLRSLDSPFLVFLSDNSIWGQWTQMLQILWSQG